MKRARIQGFSSVAAALAAIILMLGSSSFGQKGEQISGTAMGTGQQTGRIIRIDLHIYERSLAADQKALLDAFAENGSEGLANALDKMKAKGRIAITGTLGYDVNYIREFKMPDGSRKIRFVTDRPIRFGEAWGSTRSMDYQISIGEIIIRMAKGKSSGTLLPATKVKLNKDGEIEFEAFQNPWNLTNISVYKK